MLTTNGIYELCACFPIGHACGNERLSHMYEEIVLYHVKSQLTEFLNYISRGTLLKPAIISAVTVLLSSSPSELSRLRIKSSTGSTETGIIRNRKMHLGAIRQTAGLPLGSLFSHSSHNPHLLSPIPPPTTTTE